MPKTGPEQLQNNNNDDDNNNKKQPQQPTRKTAKDSLTKTGTWNLAWEYVSPLITHR